MGLVHTVEGNTEVLNAIKGKIERQGGVVAGDETAGTFCVQGFEGTYSVCGPALTLEITKKPGFIPDSMIKGWLKSNLG